MAEGEELDNRDSSVREQDRFLPIANISRIMKKALPNNAKIAKDAKETVQECVSEFISFITSECAPLAFTPSYPRLPRCERQRGLARQLDRRTRAGGSRRITAPSVTLRACKRAAMLLGTWRPCYTIGHSAFQQLPATDPSSRT